ncbi:hypothetical protein MBM_07213 [Drepanopeziza brunnea f. sp. 'multigermtubi' MB_m1]|uniref:Uncharacterized protein n=1 Tax=Marssonina brunnea f. sp. multigermtubi (strain MB_m1) TaxID=1072389 RepID=K1WQ10_MARBU|nr:uncharacterized protein MBM_07213 [Drepanopeziza brunnea f. sp. 'multigermtubi' MB_m1]EKD14492.1 hypothetical protein MBM_07213 [Drepanopeziza brunnea f. sp. 'multigermtubi' MB_m1]
MQIARLSAERQKESWTLDLASNNISISDIESSLGSWRHVPAATALRDEDSMHQDQDVMHCSEAWRNGLLLYIFRAYHGARTLVSRRQYDVQAGLVATFPCRLRAARSINRDAVCQTLLHLGMIGLDIICSATQYLCSKKSGPSRR